MSYLPQTKQGTAPQRGAPEAVRTPQGQPAAPQYRQQQDWGPSHKAGVNPENAGNVGKVIDQAYTQVGNLLLYKAAFGEKAAAGSGVKAYTPPSHGATTTPVSVKGKGNGLAPGLGAPNTGRKPSGVSRSGNTGKRGTATLSGAGPGPAPHGGRSGTFNPRKPGMQGSVLGEVQGQGQLDFDGAASPAAPVVANGARARAAQEVGPRTDVSDAQKAARRPAGADLRSRI